MGARIVRVNVSVEPWRFNDKQSELRFTVRIPGWEAHYSKVIDDNDFESLFDYVLLEAAHALKQQIKTGDKTALLMDGKP